MTRQDYNGWMNYETWLCKLWIDNEQGSQEYWLERAKEAAVGAEARIQLADWLKEEFEDGSPCPDAGFYTDLLNAALGEVNWLEIAENLLEEVSND